MNNVLQFPTRPSTEASRSECLTRIVRARLLLTGIAIRNDEAVTEALAALDARLVEIAGRVMR
jgi:hypothetical protein